MRYAKLSYNISKKATANPSTREPNAVKITPVEKLSEGDNGNVFKVELLNHCGTHIDLPKHMIEGGKGLTDFSIENFIYEKPLVLDIPLKDGQLLSKDELMIHHEKLSSCDLLLVRSGFSQFRTTNLKRYVWDTPGVSVEAADYIVKSFPKIKAVGVDFMSFEPIKDTSHGFGAHKILLSKEVFIIEDLNLQDIDNEIIDRVFALPLFVEEVDSFPVTVVAEMEKKSAAANNQD